MDSNIAIEVKNVTKTFRIYHEKKNSVYEYLTSFFNKNNSFEELSVLKDISFSVKKGEMLGIIGLNGSGKTTLLKIIGKIYIPNQGFVEIKGKLTPFLGLGTGFNGEFTARDNIILYGVILGFTKKEIERKIDDIVRFAELEKFLDTKLKNFSSGMNARLAFSTAIQVDPDIMLVDEILSVGDIPFREKSFNAFMEFKKKGKTIILVSHDPQQIKSLCDKAIWIHDGSIQSYGNPEKVVDDYTKFILKLKNKKNFKNVSRGYTLNNTLNDFQGKNPLTNIGSTTFAKQVDESCPNGVKDYYAVVLNGSSQYLSRKTEPDIEVGNYSFLAGIWLKSTKKDSSFSLFHYGSGEKGKQMWRLTFVNGSLRANVDDGNTRLTVEDTEANRLLDGKWHFACILVDRSNLVMHLFADGKSVASADISRIGTNSLNSEGENFLIGALKNRDGKIRGYFQDSLMNFQLYNIADYNLPQILSQGRREIIQMS